MSIWFNKPTLSRLKSNTNNTIIELVGIEFVEIGNDYLKATMPVDNRTCQPMGILHGGASALLAETLASCASVLCVNPKKSFCLGLTINANHIMPVSQGFVIGIARPLHIGKKTHIWDVQITDKKKNLICTSRVTMAVIPR
jgi:1,4-dihydroxy-2-naphthoyl-CoA hydrolase